MMATSAAYNIPICICYSIIRMQVVILRFIHTIANLAEKLSQFFHFVGEFRRGSIQHEVRGRVIMGESKLGRIGLLCHQATEEQKSKRS
jgi:hypothetical protein